MMIVTIVVLLARAALVLSALTDFIGLVWFAETNGIFVAISGALTVAGSFAVALIPSKVIKKGSNDIFYIIVLFVAIVTTMVLMIAVNVNDDQVLDVAMYGVVHVVLLAVVGWSVLRKQNK